MGIKSSFKNFLKSECPNIFEEINLQEYSFKKIAIDISLYLNKYIAISSSSASMEEDEYKSNNIRNGWIISFIKLIACLRRNEIHCVFIFDGKSPIEKLEEQNKRKDSRNNLEEKIYELEMSLDNYYKTGEIDDCLIKLYKSRRSPERVSLLNKNNNFSGSINMKWVEDKIKQKRGQIYKITEEHYNIAKKIFDILKVPYITAPSEAEKMCAGLNILSLVDGVLSEDTDVIAYCSLFFLCNIDIFNDTCIKISHNNILESLDVNKDQFLDFCIMCGTDYNSNIPRVGSKTAFKHIKTHGSIEKIKENTVLDTSILNHERVRELFTEFEEYDFDKIDYCGRPDFNILSEFLSNYNLSMNIELLENDFKAPEIIFEKSDDD